MYPTKNTSRYTGFYLLWTFFAILTGVCWSMPAASGSSSSYGLGSARLVKRVPREEVQARRASPPMQPVGTPTPIPALQRHPHDGNGTLELQFARKNLSIHLEMKRADYAKLYNELNAQNSNFSAGGHWEDMVAVGVALGAGVPALKYLKGRHELGKTMDKWHSEQDKSWMDDKKIKWDKGEDPEELKNDWRKFNKVRDKKIKQLEFEANELQKKINKAEGTDPENYEKWKKELGEYDDLIGKMENSKYTSASMESLLKEQASLKKTIAGATGEAKNKAMAKLDNVENDLRKNGWEGDAKTGLTTRESKDRYLISDERYKELKELTQEERENMSADEGRAWAARKKAQEHLDNGEERTKKSYGDPVRGEEGAVNEEKSFGQKFKKTFGIKSDLNTMQHATLAEKDMKASYEKELQDIEKKLDMAQNEGRKGFFDKTTRKWKKTFTSDQEIEDLESRKAGLQRRLKNVDSKLREPYQDSHDLYEKGQLEGDMKKADAEIGKLENPKWYNKIAFWKSKANRDSRLRDLKEQKAELQSKLEKVESKLKAQKETSMPKEEKPAEVPEKEPGKPVEKPVEKPTIPTEKSVAADSGKSDELSRNPDTLATSIESPVQKRKRKSGAQKRKAKKENERKEQEEKDKKVKEQEQQQREVEGKNEDKSPTGNSQIQQAETKEVPGTEQPVTEQKPASANPLENAVEGEEPPTVEVPKVPAVNPLEAAVDSGSGAQGMFNNMVDNSNAMQQAGNVLGADGQAGYNTALKGEQALVSGTEDASRLGTVAEDEASKLLGLVEGAR